MIDLDKLERLEKAAFPSPWSIDMDRVVTTVYCETNGHHVGGFDDDPSASFIVALRNAAPALLAELRRLRAIEAAAREVAANVEDDIDERLRYVVVQPSREEWAALNAALAAKEASA